MKEIIETVETVNTAETAEIVVNDCKQFCGKCMFPGCTGGCIGCICNPNNEF